MQLNLNTPEPYIVSYAKPVCLKLTGTSFMSKERI